MKVFKKIGLGLIVWLEKPKELLFKHKGTIVLVNILIVKVV